MSSELWQKNMGNMGFSKTKIWLEYGMLCGFVEEIWDKYGIFIRISKTTKSHNGLHQPYVVSNTTQKSENISEIILSFLSNTTTYEHHIMFWMVSCFIQKSTGCLVMQKSENMFVIILCCLSKTKTYEHQLTFWMVYCFIQKSSDCLVMRNFEKCL